MSKASKLLRKWLGRPKAAGGQRKLTGDTVNPDVWIRHRLWHHLPAEGAFITTCLPILDDHSVERLLSAYRRSHGAGHYGRESMWRVFFESRHAGLHEIFMKGSVNEARQALAEPGKSDLFYGFDNLMADCVRVLKQGPDGAPREYYDWIVGFGDRTGQEQSPDKLLHAHATHLLDDLLRCAEAWGAIREENPEWGVMGSPDPAASQWRNNQLTADAVLDKLEESLQIQIIFPNPYPDDFGLVTRRGLATYRAIQSLHLGLMLKNLAREIPSPRIMEIGGGLGRVACYGLQFGLPRYEIVDLAFTGISQGYFLMSALGADKVVLSGEAAGEHPGTVKLSSPLEFLESKERYDLIVNMDSLTEIDPKIARQYWEKIEHCASRFLSINHERNPFTVKDLYSQSRRVKRVSRHPYWLRRGYVEELVEFA